MSKKRNPRKPLAQFKAWARSKGGKVLHYIYESKYEARNAANCFGGKPIRVLVTEEIHGRPQWTRKAVAGD